MMRSLWTAASGMLSQQTNLDTIANNLSNINTVGFKKETTEFKSLLYQTLREDSYDSEGEPKAIGVQVGSGVRNSAITAQFSQGSFTATDNPFDIAIEGRGFFMIRDNNGETAYTRNGSFQLSVGVNGLTLTNSQGNPVLSREGNEIVMNPEWSIEDISINENGQVLHMRNVVQVYDANDNLKWLEDSKGNIIDKDGKIITQAANNARANGTDTTRYSLRDVTTYDVMGVLGLAQFNNPAGLKKSGGTFLYESDASGEPRIEGVDTGVRFSKTKQGYLEASNVQAVDEMVNMIVAQRAYELNSKIITASDEMLQQANNLRR